MCHLCESIALTLMCIDTIALNVLISSVQIGNVDILRKTNSQSKRLSRLSKRYLNFVRTVMKCEKREYFVTTGQLCSEFSWSPSHMINRAVFLSRLCHAAKPFRYLYLGLPFVFFPVKFASYHYVFKCVPPQDIHKECELSKSTKHCKSQTRLSEICQGENSAPYCLYLLCSNICYSNYFQSCGI